MAASFHFNDGEQQDAAKVGEEIACNVNCYVELTRVLFILHFLEALIVVLTKHQSLTTILSSKTYYTMALPSAKFFVQKNDWNKEFLLRRIYLYEDCNRTRKWSVEGGLERTSSVKSIPPKFDVLNRVFENKI